MHPHALRLMVLSVLLVFTTIVGCQSAHTDEVFISPSISAGESPIGTTEAPRFDCVPSAASYGSIMGILYLTDHRPAVGSIIYLGEYVGEETGTPMIIVDPGRSRHTETVEGGAFCFRDVPPGRYGLVVWDAVESVLLADPSTGYSLIVEVRSGNTVDVGKVFSPIP